MSATYDFDCECDNFEMLEDQDVFTMNEGIPGPGVPAGGSAGQILQKHSDADYDTEWTTPDGYVPAGGSSGQILKKSSAADYDTEWDSLDAGDVSFDSSLTYASGSVGKEICDVKNTLSHKADVIYDTASGDIASFPDGADGLPVKDLTVGIEPVQDLHGYENPWPAGGGKNKLQVTASSTTDSGITFTVNDDGTIKVTGTASADTTLTVNSNVNYIADGTYILNGCPSGGSSSTYSLQLIKAPSPSLSDQGNGVQFTKDSSTTLYQLYLHIKNGYACPTGGLLFKPMIRLASESDATFAPYSNICPISGRTGCNVSKTGKNLFPDSSHWEVGAIGTDGQNATGDSHMRTVGYFPIPGGISFVTSGYTTETTSNFRIFFYDSQKTFIEYKQGKNIQWETPANATYFRARWKATGESAIDMSYAQLELGSTATAYEPYSGTTIPISWQSEAGTVYGGTLDVVSGELSVNYVKEVYDENSGFTLAGGSGYPYYFMKAIDQNYSSTNPRCNVFSPAYINWDNSNNGFRVINGYLRVRYTPLFTTLQEFNAWLANNNLEVCYQLATPLAYTLTPTQISTLYGHNNIWADCGPVSVEYPADTKLYIDKKLAALVAALS